MSKRVGLEVHGALVAHEVHLKLRRGGRLDRLVQPRHQARLRCAAHLERLALVLQLGAQEADLPLELGDLAPYDESVDLLQQRRRLLGVGVGVGVRAGVGLYG